MTPEGNYRAVNQTSGGWSLFPGNGAVRRVPSTCIQRASRCGGRPRGLTSVCRRLRSANDLLRADRQERLVSGSLINVCEAACSLCSSLSREDRYLIETEIHLHYLARVVGSTCSAEHGIPSAASCWRQKANSGAGSSPPSLLIIKMYKYAFWHLTCRLQRDIFFPSNSTSAKVDKVRAEALQCVLCGWRAAE